MIKRDEKFEENLNELKNCPNDTGSVPVQLLMMTQRIVYLTNHLKEHPKDNHSRFGLLKIVKSRRKLLDYLRRKDKEHYKFVIKLLGIRK